MMVVPGGGDRVEAANVKGMTTKKAAQRHPTSRERAEALDRAHGVLATGGRETARWWQPGRDHGLIALEQEEERGLWQALHD